ncbi:hypothetical protein BKA80DRAFT_270304 [Phyllosticta citrichinensis]
MKTRMTATIGMRKTSFWARNNVHREMKSCSRKTNTNPSSTAAGAVIIAKCGRIRKHLHNNPTNLPPTHPAFVTTTSGRTLNNPRRLRRVSCGWSSAASVLFAPCGCDGADGQIDVFAAFDDLGVTGCVSCRILQTEHRSGFERTDLEELL